MLRFLVFPWGSPWKTYPPKSDNDFFWKPVMYKFSDFPRKVKCRTTLPLFVKRFCMDSSVDYHCSIVVLDTIYSLIMEGRQIKEYKGIEILIEKAYRDFVDNILRDNALKMEKDRVDIIVAPGVGEYVSQSGKVLRVNGRLYDYYNYVLYSLGLKLSELASKRDSEKVEIILDITHGINFMPTLTYIIVKELAELLSLVVKEVRLRVYNSEPVLQSRNTEDPVIIHEVEDTRMSFRPIHSRLQSKVLKTYGSNEALENVKKVNKSFKTLIKEHNMNAFLGAIRNCLPLVLINTAFDPSRLRDAIKETVEIFKENIEVSQQDYGMLIKRKITFDKCFHLFFKTYFLRSIMDLKSSEVASLKDLKDITDRFFKGWNPSYNLAIIELNKIYKNVVEEASRDHTRLSDWTLLADILKECQTRGEGRSNKEVIMRNFIAHVGLLKDYTYVRCLSSQHEYDKRLSWDEILLKYKEDDRKELYEYATEGLSKEF